MKKRNLLSIAYGLIIGSTSLYAEPTAAEPMKLTELEEVAALGKLTSAPKMQDAEGIKGGSDNLKPIFFDTLDWKGKPTKAFAWLGLPKNAKGKVPGVVLVHGGGGSAFKLWVEKWNAKGYAAISIAVEGQTDEKEGKVWKKHQWSGPARQGIYHDSNVPLKEQWMYHAVADTILANSLLRSLPEVDADKVGIMGISWGGVITSTVIGIDNRYAFAIPTYGCGALESAKNQYGKSLGNNDTYKQVWDPMLRLEKATMPTMWFSWPEDKHFPMDKFAKSYHKAKGDHMVCLIPKLGHGHGPPWNKPDSYAFAESIVNTEKLWCKMSSISLEGSTVNATFSSSKSLESATLVSTVDTGVTGERKWVESPATIVKDGDKWKVTSALPEKSTAWFINVKSGDLIASSDYQER